MALGAAYGAKKVWDFYLAKRPDNKRELAGYGYPKFDRDTHYYEKKQAGMDYTVTRKSGLFSKIKYI